VATKEKGAARELKLGDHRLKLDRTLIMGILNVTPDSFSDGGLYAEAEAAFTCAKKMVEEGADIIDVGGESTKPGASPVSEDEELRRVLPVIERLTSSLAVPVSIDTVKPEIARRCLAAGAVMVNDTQGLRDDEMLQAVVESGAAVVIMHMKGTPETMQEQAAYADLVSEVRSFLIGQAGRARGAGVHTVLVDPGLGFAKTAEHNLEILNRLEEFTDLGYPLLIGPSRKAFIGVLTGAPAGGRLGGTLAAVTASVLKGVSVVRVHDVAACKQATMVAEAIRNG
jgi:dihydropteroate synthase